MERSRGWFETAYKDNDSIWIVPAHSYYFYRYDVISGECDEPICFPTEVIRENKTRERAFGSLQKVGNCLYFIPAQTRFFLIYDITTGKFDEIDMGTNMPQFYKSIVVDNHIFMFSICYPEMHYFDISSKEMRDWIDLSQFTNEKLSFTTYVTFHEGKIIAPSNDSNHILISDLSSGDTELLQYGNNRHGLPCCIDDRIYTIADNGKNLEIEIYNRKDELYETVQITDYPSEWVNEKLFIPFLIAKKVDNLIYYFPKNSGGYIVTFDLETKESNVIKHAEDFDSFSNVITGNELDEYIYDFKTDCLVNLNNLSEEIDMQTEKCYRDFHFLKIKTEMKEGNKIPIESEKTDLRNFFEIVLK